MRRIKSFIFVAILMFSFANQGMVLAKNNSNDGPARTGEITPKTVGAGALSLIIWPGIGQAVNNDNGEKVLIHALLGLVPIYRVWSCYDAVVDRKGGYWHGRI